MELIQEMVTVYASSTGFVKVVGSFPARDNDMVFYALALLIAVAVLEFLRFLSLILILLSTTRSTSSFFAFVLNFCADSLVYIKFFFLSLIAIFNFI